MDDDDRIIERAGERLEEVELARPEFGQPIEDDLELRAAFARGNQMAFERGKSRRGEGVAQEPASVNLAGQDAELAAGEARLEALQAGPHEDGELLVEADAMTQGHGS
jgi:hypothetical protein